MSSETEEVGLYFYFILIKLKSHAWLVAAFAANACQCWNPSPTLASTPVWPVPGNLVGGMNSLPFPSWRGSGLHASTR